MHIALPLIVMWFLRRWKRIVIVLCAYDSLLIVAIIYSAGVALHRRHDRWRVGGGGCHRYYRRLRMAKGYGGPARI